MNPLHTFPSCIFKVTFIINLPSRRTQILGARSLKYLTFVVVSNIFITYQNTWRGTLHFTVFHTANRQQVSPPKSCLHVSATCSNYWAPALKTLPIQLPVWLITVPSLKYVFIISFVLLTSKYFLVGIHSQFTLFLESNRPHFTTIQKKKRCFLYSVEYHYYVGSTGTDHHLQQQMALLCSSAALTK